MKGDGNSISTLLQKLYFYMIPTSMGRTKYMIKNKKKFHHIGKNFFFQPRKFPADPEFLSFGDNVKISAGVIFINHDISFAMLNDAFSEKKFRAKRGCIYVGNNVMIGANVIILPDIKIGNNVIIGAGAIVTKDIPNNSVVAGVPCKVLGTFDEFVNKRLNVKVDSLDVAWDSFFKLRNM